MLEREEVGIVCLVEWVLVIFDLLGQYQVLGFEELYYLIELFKVMVLWLLYILLEQGWLYCGLIDWCYWLCFICFYGDVVECFCCQVVECFVLLLVELSE